MAEKEPREAKQSSETSQQPIEEQVIHLLENFGKSLETIPEPLAEALVPVMQAQLQPIIARLNTAVGDLHDAIGKLNQEREKLATHIATLQESQKQQKQPQEGEEMLPSSSRTQSQPEQQRSVWGGPPQVQPMGESQQQIVTRQTEQTRIVPAPQPKLLKVGTVVPSYEDLPSPPPGYRYAWRSTLKGRELKEIKRIEEDHGTC